MELLKYINEKSYSKLTIDVDTLIYTTNNQIKKFFLIYNGFTGSKIIEVLFPYVTYFSRLDKNEWTCSINTPILIVHDNIYSTMQKLKEGF